MTYGTTDITGYPVTPTNVPTHGLTTDDVKAKVIGLAISFFGRVLNRAGDDDRPLGDCLRNELENRPAIPEPSQQELDEAELHAGDPD
jgi:hypothetical protein